MLKQCLQCKKEYKIKPSHFNKSSYCSKDCMVIGYQFRFSGKNNPNYKNAGKIKCLECSNTFISYNKTRKFCSPNCSTTFRWKNNKNSFNRKIKPKVHQIKIKKIRFSKIWTCQKCSIPVRRKVKFCSTACRKKVSKIKLICCFCKKDFTRWPSESRGVNNNYCSKKCCLRNRSGQNNSNWKGGRKGLCQLIRDCEKNKVLKTFILRRDRYKCQICGQVGGRLEVDHIKKFSIVFDEFITKYKTIKNKEELFKLALKHPPFWFKNNLQVLCKQCNWQKEINYRKSQKHTKGWHSIR